MSSGAEQAGTRVPVPRLVLELESWPRVFFSNLGDRLLFRGPKPVAVTARPAPFWPDVFVSQRLPFTALRQSLLYHLFVVVAVWGFTQTWMLRPQVRVENPTRNTRLTYYQVSEYLPSLATASTPVKLARKGQPAYSKQPIISMPELPDNTRQTIVNPRAPKLLPNPVKLPNVIAWTQIPVPPVTAASRSTKQLTLPWQVAMPAPPPVENPARKPAELNLPANPPSVVEPAPELTATKRKLGDINLGQVDVPAPAPALPVAEQRAAGAGENVPAVAPPPPSTVSSAGAEQSVGELIALGLSPAPPPPGPIDVPAGNRRGQFAATPEGKPGAPGTPDIPAGPEDSGSGAKRTAGAGSSTGAIPAGISVGGGPTPNRPVAVVGNAPASGPPGPLSPEAQKKILMAAATRPRLRDIPRATGPARPTGGKIVDEVFGAKRYYSMILNMPNLTSAGGSWIIRFAELRESQDQSELTAPVAVHKVDPAYPPELMRQHVEGTVTLYAVIHADGTVGDVKVLRGVDETLDRNARVALQRWQFRPATKNGLAVDLEAVVQIPFAARKLPY